MIEKIQDWVQKLMEPWLDDPDTGAEELMSMARKRPHETTKFKRTLQHYPDLVHGAMYPETDEDIIVAIIMRYINDNIFQKLLYGAIHHYTEVISFIENQMQSTVEPKRGKNPRSTASIRWVG